MPIWLCPKWCSKELSESLFPYFLPITEPVVLKAQCRLNLAKDHQTYISSLLKSFTFLEEERKCDERERITGERSFAILIELEFNLLIRTLMANNPNAPENILTPWLVNMDDYSMGARVYDKDMSGFEMALLAHILEFSDKNHKLYEMLCWLGTEEAKLFFTNASEHSEAIYREFQIIDDLTDFPELADDPEFIDSYLAGIRGWIQENYQELPVALKLN